MAIATYKDLLHRRRRRRGDAARSGRRRSGSSAGARRRRRRSTSTGPTPQHRSGSTRCPSRSPSSSGCTSTCTPRRLDEVLARGATPRRRRARSAGRSCADPEGGELCVFVRDEVPAYKLYEIVVDARRRRTRSRRWWAEVLGATVAATATRTTAARGSRTRRGCRSSARLRDGARAQDGQEPDPLGRRDRRRPGAARPRRDPAARAATTTSTGTCWPTPRATSSARSRPRE